jgi:hypothetical protein
MRSRLLSEQCTTCIFRKGNRMRLAPGRLADLVDQCETEGSFVVCHATLPEVAPNGTSPAICRGFYDRFATQALQVISRLFGFILVSPPGQPDPPEGTPIPEPGWMNAGRVHRPRRRSRG